MLRVNSIRKVLFLIFIFNLLGTSAYATVTTMTTPTKVHAKVSTKHKSAKAKKAKHVKHSNAYHPTSKHHTHKTYQKIHAQQYSSVFTKQPSFALANQEYDDVVDEQEEVKTESTSMVSSFKGRLVDYIYKTVDTLHHNSYKLGGTRFDSKRGDYVLDCSSYVDHLLQRASPKAFFNLVDATGADKPTTQHYYDFFTGLSDYHNYYWNKVDEVSELRPGDILVFRYKKYGYETGGHVVVVMEKPIQDSDVFFLRIADSAPSPHSEDTRSRHQSGIGIGTMLLKINPKTGEPSAYSWGINGYWNKNVNFAMARPRDFS